jgi:hypothetical protein
MEMFLPLWIQIRNYKSLPPGKMTAAVQKLTAAEVKRKIPRYLLSSSVASPQSSAVSSEAAMEDSADAVESASEAAAKVEDEDEDAEEDEENFLSSGAHVKPYVGSKRRASNMLQQQQQQQQQAPKPCIRLVMSVRDADFGSCISNEGTTNAPILSIRLRGVPSLLPARLRDALHHICTDSRLPTDGMKRSRASILEMTSCFGDLGYSSASVPSFDGDFSTPGSS